MRGFSRRCIAVGVSIATEPNLSSGVSGVAAVTGVAQVSVAIPSNNPSSPVFMSRPPVLSRLDPGIGNQRRPVRVQHRGQHLRRYGGAEQVTLNQVAVLEAQ